MSTAAVLAKALTVFKSTILGVKVNDALLIVPVVAELNSNEVTAPAVFTDAT